VGDPASELAYGVEPLRVSELLPRRRKLQAALLRDLKRFRETSIEPVKFKQQDNQQETCCDQTDTASAIPAARPLDRRSC
jgi:hypothetical protein